MIYYHTIPVQFDALIERLTGRELLTMYARLRGIPEKQIKHVVDTEIRRLDLQKHASKHCGSYRWVGREGQRGGGRGVVI